MNEIKKVIFNNPATIVIWDDNSKTVVKASKDDVFDAETGLAMAITKKKIDNIHWKQVFEIITPDDEVKGKFNRRKLGDDRTIALCYVRVYYHNDINWYKKFAAWLPKEKKVEPVANVDWTETNPEAESYIGKKPDILQKEPTLNERIVDMFNSGLSINKISKETGISEYFVKKYIDAATAPKANKNKANRILNKATKVQTARKTYTRRTQIDFPSYLDNATCERLLAETKEKYKDNKKVTCLSELQKWFDWACKREYIKTHYAQGYDMYTIGKVIGTSASAVQRMWNELQSTK